MKKLLSLFFFIQVITASFGQKNNLDYYVDQALTNSPLLVNFQNQLFSLQLDSQLIHAALRPQVNGIGNGLFAPVIGGWGYDEAITNKQQLTALIQVSKSFLSSKTIASQIAALNIQGLSATNTNKISQQDLRKAVIDQYITTYGEQLQLDFSNHMNEMLKKEEEILKKLTRDNVYKQADYLAFVVTLQQQLLNALQLEIQYNFDHSTLNYLAGIVDTAIVRLENPQLNSTALGDFTSSVFYRQFVLDSLKLVNDKALIDLIYRPKINVFADAGYNTTFNYKPYKNIGSSIGINVTIPIYDGRQKKLQYSKIDLQERTRIARRDFFVRQHDQQVLQLMQQLNATDRLIDQINKQIKYTETLITVNEKLLATGDIRLADFILTLNNYYTAKNLVTLNYVSRLKIMNQLNYWSK
jgi:outer membrane protein TolC